MRIAGSASSALRTVSPIILCSVVRGTNVSERATPYAGYLRAWWRCAFGLVGGEAFSIDASLIKADVDRKKRIPGDQPFAWPKAEKASHAVREYLAALDAARGDEDRGGGDGGSSEVFPPRE